MTSKTFHSRQRARLLATLAVSAVVLGTATSVAYGQDYERSSAITVPPVPVDIRVPAGNKPFLVGHATGTQNYICLPSGGAFKFTLFTPQATLFDDDKQLTTHFFSPNPDEAGTVRPAWQHSRDSSTVWGQATGSSTDAAFVAPGAIPWVRLDRAGSKDGPDGGDKLSVTTFIQRINTAGGVAPSTGCASAADVGKQQFVPYKADYIFYKKAG